MRYHDSNEFTPPLKDDEEPLVVHRRPGATSSNIVIFVHGLGGKRYGTWGDFPAFVFKDFEKRGVDVGMYSYPTLWGRLHLSMSIDLEDAANVFADTLRDLGANYTRIVLIGHSMGGLLAKGAIKSLIDRNERAALARIAGLVLMATPQTGSQRVPSALAWFSRDAKALKPHGDFVIKLNRMFTDRVVQTPAEVEPGMYCIPTWAVLSPADQWVDQLSAGLNIPSSRRKEVTESHTSIVKPSHQGTDAYDFVRNALDICFTPPAAPPAITAPFQASDFGLPAPVMSPASSLAVSQTAQRPPLDELFEVITDPDDVLDALFHTEQTNAIRPSSVDYLPRREAMDDVQQAIGTALLEAGGRLLISAPEGIGKTREIAEYARTACAKNWKVLRARSDRDSLLGPVLSLPQTLIDSRLLILVDNLHSRILGGADQPVPYADRLEQLLKSLERHLPGDVRVLVTTRDEPTFQALLGSLDDQPSWRTFRLFRLPPHTEEGLQQMLTALAQQAGVAVEADEVPKLVTDSDHKPETIFINVNEARRKATPLTRATWWPSEGESWRERFVSARSKHAGVERIGQALRLLQEVGLPARAPYVMAVARAAGEPDPRPAINVLLDSGLLASRGGRLAAFSTEQLEQQLGSSAESKLKIADYWQVLEEAIVSPPIAAEVSANDLLSLALGLLRARLLGQAEGVASRAADLAAAGSSRAFRVRAGIRFQMQRLAEADVDLSRALEIGGEEGDTRFLRGATRTMLGRFDEAVQDFDAAIGGGRDDAAIYALRASAYFQLGLFPQAATDLTAAIDRGESSGMIFFMRGLARLQLQDFAGSELDLTAALERGIRLQKMLSAIETWNFADDPSAVAAAGAAESERAFVRALRGIARLMLGKWGEAEDDFSAAINGKASEQALAYAANFANSSIPIMRKAAAQFDRANDFEGELFQRRGVARLRQGRPKEAEEDFDAAEARGFSTVEVNFGRGQAYLFEERYAEAEQCLTITIDGGKRDAFSHSFRGLARQALSKFAEAEQDFDAAIVQYGRDDADVFRQRAVARTNQGKLKGAQADLTEAVNRGLAADVDVRSLRAEIRLDLGENAGAEEDLSAAIDLGRKDAAVFFSRGKARGGQGQWPAAEEDFRAAIAAGRDDAETHYLLAHTLNAQRRYADAEAELDFALQRDDDPDIRTFRGQMRLVRTDIAGATEDFDAVVAKKPAHAEALRLRGIARYVQQDWTGALADYDAAFAAAPDNPDVLGARVMAKLRIGTIDDAARDCAELEKIDRKGAETDGCYGALELVRGDFDGAVERLAKAAEADTSWYSWLGIGYLMTGETEKARDAFRFDAAQRAPVDNIVRLDDLEFCASLHPDRVAGSEAQAVLTWIRAELAANA